MKFIKASGVPLPITYFVDGADKLGTSWGGRNLGLGVASAQRSLIRWDLQLRRRLCSELFAAAENGCRFRTTG